MRKRKFDYLVKHFEMVDGPEGLYPEQLFWKEAKDMEGFNCVYGNLYITKPCQFHPAAGMVTHPYPEVLAFCSLNPDDILSMDAEFSIELGEEREKYVFNEPTVIVIPAGLPHGSVQVTRVGEPFIHYVIGLNSEYIGKITPPEQLPPPVPGSCKYKNLPRKHLAHKSQMDNARAAGDTAFTGHESEKPKSKVLDARGVLHPREGGVGPGNGDQIIWMHGEDLDNLNLNFTHGYESHEGKWHRGGEFHVHPEEEILICIGKDAYHPMELGCEVELGMGPEGERYVLNQPGFYIAPKGFPHLPMITRWVDHPWIFQVVCLDGSHGSPWIEMNLDSLIEEYNI